MNRAVSSELAIMRLRINQEIITDIFESDLARFAYLFWDVRATALDVEIPARQWLKLSGN
jgi:hypothetical protein